MYLCLVSTVGSTSLIAASYNGHLDVVNVLIKTNADVHLKVGDDKMALDDAEKRDTQRL